MPVGMGTIFGTMTSNVDNDWYVLSLEAGRPYTVSLKGIPEGDDYDLYIFDTNILDIGLSFNGGNADEVLNFTPTVTGNYYIHADCHTLGTGSDHSYQLLIYPDDTAPDAYEPNDSIGTAKTISNNIPISGTINISTDEDWYEFSADNAGKLTVTLDSIPNDCDYDVEIYDGESNLLSGSYFSGNTNEKADVLVDVGNYYVRMYSYSGSSQSTYSLNTNLSTPDLYEVNDSVSSAMNVLVDSSSFGTIDNIKDEDYFVVDIDETENYVFELQNIPSGKDYDLSLFDSSGNAIAYSWNSSNNDELINISLSPGCYYIKLHAYSGFSCVQNYVLSVYRQNALTLSMPYIRANAGDIISVPVAIQDLPSEGLCAFDFILDYDSTAMTYLGYTVDYSDPNGALVDAEQAIEANEACDGVFKVLFLDKSNTFTRPLNESGIVIRLNFQVNTEAPNGAYEISFTDGSFAKYLSEDIVAVSHTIFKHGLVMVGSYGLTSFQINAKAQNLISMDINDPEGKPGDINWDGEVNSLDFAIYRLYLIGMRWTFPTPPTGHSSDEVADLNGDGDTNSLDFGYLRLYLLGVIDCFPVELTENPLTVLDQYLLRQVSETEANTALGRLSTSSSIELQTFTSNLGYDYQRYDYLIKGWIEYFKVRKNWEIDGEIIKAMMLRESHMGYQYSTSPNENITRDVMQCLDPRNAAIYEFVNIDPKNGSRIYVHNANHRYVLLNSGEVDNKSGKGRGILYNFAPVAGRLFDYQFQGIYEFYYYQYNMSSPTLSTLLGIAWYRQMFIDNNLNPDIKSDKITAAIRYNGGGDSGYGSYISNHLTNRNGDD